MLLRNRYLLCGFSVILIALIGLACDPEDPSNLGPSNSQQIFGEWRLSEIIRNGCDDADNNYRRACDECPTLTMDTDYTFRITNDDKELITQGTFDVKNDTDITFDPGIFTTQGVSSVRYSLITGAMKFNYTDMTTLCSVTESYLVSSGNAGGD